MWNEETENGINDTFDEVISGLGKQAIRLLYFGYDEGKLDLCRDLMNKFEELSKTEDSVYVRLVEIMRLVVKTNNEILEKKVIK